MLRSEYSRSKLIDYEFDQNNRHQVFPQWKRDFKFRNVRLKIAAGTSTLWTNGNSNKRTEQKHCCWRESTIFECYYIYTSR